MQKICDGPVFLRGDKSAVRLSDQAVRNAGGLNVRSAREQKKMKSKNVQKEKE